MPHRGFPALMAPSGIRNRLARNTAPSDFIWLAPDWRRSRRSGPVLSRAGDQIEHVFFPIAGAFSLMIDMADGGRSPPP